MASSNLDSLWGQGKSYPCVALSAALLAGCVLDLENRERTPITSDTSGIVQRGGGVAVASGCAGTVSSDPANTSSLGVPVPLGTSVSGCIADTDDSDYLLLTPPPDAPPAGGYARLELYPYGDLWGELKFSLAESDRSLGGDEASNRGAHLVAFLSMAPRTTYRLRITSYVGGGLGRGGGDYTLDTMWVPFDDPYEPNQSRSTAAPIAVGELVEAYSTWGANDSDDDPRTVVDWYAVRLNAGPVRIGLSNTPAEFWPQVDLFDAGDKFLSGEAAPNSGANVTLETEIPTSDTYFVRISNDMGNPTGLVVGTSARLPMHFSMPYQLTVSQ